MNWRIGVLLGVVAMSIAIALMAPPVPQDPAYHDFADQRELFGIPNFWNVVSNLPFLIAGIYGCWIWPKSDWGIPSDKWPWLILAIAASGIAVGSGYYHLWPDDRTLVWDRLPMTLGFMSILAATLGERIHPRLGSRCLAPLLVLGLASIEYWRQVNDLRFYGLVQFFPMLALPLLLVLFPPRYTHIDGFWRTAILYTIAKLFEAADRPLFSLTAGQLSGHVLKHLFGALALAAAFHMLHRRHSLPNPPLSTK